MYITRTIWPVGHGAFYTECLGFHHPNSLVTIVYDCGAKIKEIIEDNIDVFLKSLRKNTNGKPIVDYLAISHFHKDHVNGLQYILDKADVKHLILPQFSEEVLAEAFIYNAQNTESTTECDIDSPVQQLIMGFLSQGAYSFESRAQIIQIVPRHEASEQRSEGHIIEGENLPSNIESGSRIGVSNLSMSTATSNAKSAQRWILVPINLDYPKVNFQALLKDLNNLYKEKENLPIYADNKVNWDNLRKLLMDVSPSKVKKCYEKHYGKNNAYSMPMYSGWENPSFVLDENYLFDNHSTMWHRDLIPLMCFEHRIWHRYIDWLERPLWNDYRQFQCLYMGDFETKTHFNELFNQLGPLWTEIGLQQIPHHVSEHNHNLHLYNGLHKICFGNIDDAKDRSCSLSILRSIYREGCLPLLVTEEDDAIAFTSMLYNECPISMKTT